MTGSPHLNGSDYLMLGFDHELRRHGFAGNSCEIVLELAAAVSPDALAKRVQSLIAQHPVLRARAGGVFFPKWKTAGRPIVHDWVRTHPDDPGICQKLFNDPLDIQHGGLLRFDLIARAGGRATLVFTWAHALMDAPGAEYFLAVVGDEKLPLPGPSPVKPRGSGQRLSERCRLAWKYIHHLDGYCRAAPRSPGIRRRHAPVMMNYRIERFTAEDTAWVRANSAHHCGPLGDGQFHAAVAALELHRLHQRLGSPTPSYVLPVPVGLRPKGTVEPVFSNQVAMLMIQFLPEHLDNITEAAAALKSQMSGMMRAGMLDSGVLLADLFRFLPLPVYVAALKRGLRGEICSMFYGDTAAVNPLLMNFLGVAVEDFAHVAAVTPSPGIGVVFYYFRGELRVTVLHSAQVLSEAEAAEFAASLRARLLHP
jgi:hypothetical protein